MNVVSGRVITPPSLPGTAFLVFLTLLVLLSSAVFAIMNIDDGLSSAGVYVAQTYVGELERSEVFARLLEIEESRVLPPISLVWNDKTWTLYPSRVGARLDVLETYKQVMQIGKEDNLVDRLHSFLFRPTSVVQLQPNLSYSETELARYVTWLASRIDREPRPARVVPERDGSIAVIKEAVGYRLDKTAAMDAIRQAILTMSVNRRIELPVLTITPKLTAEDIAAWPELGIMGEFATAFDPENLERTYNLKLSTNSINGYVLLPGEIFSFNRVVGPRTPARGYKQADVIVSGRLVPDYGGGVCQVSSTLYNAVLRADLQVIERQNHSLILNYIEPGTDATVSYGYLDFSFKNSTKSPVVLGAWVEDNRVEIALLGRVQTGKSVEIKTNVLERTDPPVEYREDPSLPLGQKVVERWGAPDLLVETFKIVSQDGEVVREQLVSRDRYNNAPRIIRVGTGEEVVEAVECFANTVSEEACL